MRDLEISIAADGILIRSELMNHILALRDEVEKALEAAVRQTVPMLRQKR